MLCKGEKINNISNTISKSIILLLLIFTSQKIFASNTLKSKILNSIEHFAKDHTIQSIYALSENGKIIINGAHGFYDLIDNQRLNISQIMPIGSITKQFTAAGILLLQDKGLLSVQDNIAKLLPASSGVWYGDKIPEWAHQVTLHHLLTHSSGVAEYIGSLKLSEKHTDKDTAQAVVNFAAGRPVEFEPGSEYKYCHTNFVLLGVIIENIAQQNLGEFLKKEFFYPIGMKKTFLLSIKEAIDLQKGRLSNKYPVRYYATPSKTTPKFTTVESQFLLVPNGDGGIVSNVEDLIKWNEALHHGKVLSHKSYQQMIHPYFKTRDPQTGYATYTGYGLFISKLHSGSIYYHHTGSAFGSRCDAGYIPKDNISVAIISNVTLHIPEGMSKKVDFRKPENQIDISYFRDALLESL